MPPRHVHFHRNAIHGGGVFYHGHTLQNLSRSISGCPSIVPVAWARIYGKKPVELNGQHYHEARTPPALKALMPAQKTLMPAGSVGTGIHRKIAPLPSSQLTQLSQNKGLGTVYSNPGYTYGQAVLESAGRGASRHYSQGRKKAVSSMAAYMRRLDI